MLFVILALPLQQSSSSRPCPGWTSVHNARTCLYISLMTGAIKMPQDHSARIAKARAIAKAFGIPEQEVINIALEQGSGDPAVANPAKARLAALHGQEEGLHTIDVPKERPDPWAGIRRFSGDETRFNVNDTQARAIENKKRPGMNFFGPAPRHQQ